MSILVPIQKIKLISTKYNNIYWSISPVDAELLKTYGVRVKETIHETYGVQYSTSSSVGSKSTCLRREELEQYSHYKIVFVIKEYINKEGEPKVGLTAYVKRKIQDNNELNNMLGEL